MRNAGVFQAAPEAPGPQCNSTWSVEDGVSYGRGPFL